MGSAKVDVRVLSDGREVDVALGRPVRLIESVAGVVYGGVVYPLYTGDWIDLLDQAYTKESCPFYVDDGRRIPYAARTSDHQENPTSQLVDEDDWYLESNRYGHYVVFDAPDDSALVVAEALDHNFGLVRWAASHRPADNGRLYDWFARLTLPSDLDRSVVADRVRRVLGGEGAASSDQGLAAITIDGVTMVPPAGIDLDAVPEPWRSALLEVMESEAEAFEEEAAAREAVRELEKKFDNLTQEMDTLSEANASAQRELMRLKARSEQSDLRTQTLIAEAKASAAEHQRQRDGWSQEVAVLRKALETAEARLGVQDDHVDQRLLDAQAELDILRGRADAADEARISLEQDLAAAIELASSADAEAERMKSDLRASEAEVELLEQRLETQKLLVQEDAREAQERATTKRAANARRRDASVAEVLAAALDPVLLEQGDIETLLSFPRPAKAVRLLKAIGAGAEIREGERKKLHGYPGWWEVSKIHTGEIGSGAMGRIYFKPGEDGPVALVQRKTDNDDQAQFLKSRIGPPRSN